VHCAFVLKIRRADGSIWHQAWQRYGSGKVEIQKAVLERFKEYKEPDEDLKELIEIGECEDGIANSGKLYDAACAKAEKLDTREPPRKSSQQGSTKKMSTGCPACYHRGYLVCYTIPGVTPIRDAEGNIIGKARSRESVHVPCKYCSAPIKRVPLNLVDQNKRERVAIDWFLDKAYRHPPKAAFTLRPGELIRDPAKFYADLKATMDDGQSPNRHTAGDDIVALYKRFVESKEEDAFERVAAKVVKEEEAFPE